MFKITKFLLPQTSSLVPTNLLSMLLSFSLPPRLETHILLFLSIPTALVQVYTNAYMASYPIWYPTPTHLYPLSFVQCHHLSVHLTFQRSFGDRSVFHVYISNSWILLLSYKAFFFLGIYNCLVFLLCVLCTYHQVNPKLFANCLSLSQDVQTHQVFY